MGLTVHGWREMVIGTVVLGLIGWGLGWVWWPLSFLVLPVFVWLIAFFRDPERVVGGGGSAVMVSPADGMVSDVEELAHDERLGGPAVRVGIFLSVFNVHVNRAPCAGKIINVTYTKGAFINALKHSDASTKNENNTIVLADVSSGEPVAVVRQIVGLIARTIVFPLKVGDVVERGGRIGMIKFGSRTELYIPKRLGPVVVVKVGDKVRGAMDVIARLEAAQSSGASRATAGVAAGGSATV